MSTTVFPDLSAAGLDIAVTRTPIFSTLVQKAVSGQENRAALQVYPRWQYSLVFNFLRDDATAEFRTVLAFFLARQGSFDSFLYYDVDDCSVTDQAIGVGDGTTAVFQLARSLGGFTEPVLAPRVVTNIKVNGVVQTVVTAYGIGNWQNGVSPNGALVFTGGHIPAAGNLITATMTYYWPCRFLADQYDFTKILDRIWEQKKLDFITLKNG